MRYRPMHVIYRKILRLHVILVMQCITMCYKNHSLSYAINNNISSNNCTHKLWVQLILEFLFFLGRSLNLGAYIVQNMFILYIIFL